MWRGVHIQYSALVQYTFYLGTRMMETPSMKLDERVLGLWRNTRAGHGTTLVINQLILSMRKLSYQSPAHPPLSASATSSKWLTGSFPFSRPALPFDGSSKNNWDAYHQSCRRCAQWVIVHPCISRNSYSGSLKMFTGALAYAHKGVSSQIFLLVCTRLGKPKHEKFTHFDIGSNQISSMPTQSS